VAAVIAAIIAAVVAVSLAVNSSSASNPSAHGTPATAGSAKAASSPTASITSAPGGTWTETAFTRSKTFADYVNAGYPLGAPLGPGQAVKVSCRVRGFKVEDGDPWWYRLASPPWNGQYYATSDVFYNTSNTSGNPINGITVDTRVRIC
jgi:hypothetical protein